MTYSYIKKIEPQNKFCTPKGPQNKFFIQIICTSFNRETLYLTDYMGKTDNQPVILKVLKQD